ncbi:hypothetical protein NXS98_06085 [Fontisphaera persica]|uniref:hypothetical protein n=1 Tax=Fontisphaera persica TaxID=2974023 RepID=UPI0024BFA750|nr:hypothetical protein [Fontisphaera persica]WCJ60693.1 hypothetical protein NXS98_06085 [Fontisphaera persica]
MANIEIKYGQVWQDCRNILVPRYVLVTDVSDNQVSYFDLKSRRRMSIRKTSMRPGTRGYSLVTDEKLLAKMQAACAFIPPLSVQPIQAAGSGPECPWRSSLPLVERQLLHYVFKGMSDNERLQFTRGMMKYYDENKPDGAAVRNGK